MSLQLKFAKPAHESKKSIGNYCRYEYKSYYYLNGGASMLEYNNLFLDIIPNINRISK